MATNVAGAGWQQDPLDRHEYRFWDGSAWTEHVANAGVRSTDPLAAAGSENSAEPESSPDIEADEPVEQQIEPQSSPEAPATTRAADLPIPRFGARKHAEKLQAENVRLQELIDRHGLREIADLESVKTALEEQLSVARAAVAEEQQKVTVAQGECAAVAEDVVRLRDIAGLQEFGIYDYEHPAEDSVKLSGDLEALRTQIKQAVRSGDATKASDGFTFNNSAAKGAKFVRDMSKLMLRSYNAEAENCVKSVKAGNLDAARQRLTTSMQQVERLGTMIDLQIVSQYHRLRLAELELAARHMQVLQAEKEAERARREELREQKRAEQELQAEKARLEKEKSHYQNALAALEAKGDIEGAARMREQIADAERAIADVDYRVANARAGYVYVISNIGSFGGEVVKIGMTRRLEPMDRVNELGDASVPFRFDVHAMFFSADAVALETALHQHFADRRLNRVNLRREYFRATPGEVLGALKEHDVEVLEYTLEPAAEEFRASIVSGGVQS